MPPYTCRIDNKTVRLIVDLLLWLAARILLQVNDWVFSHTIQSVEGSVSATATSPAALQQHAVPVPSAHSKYLLLVSGLQIGNPLPTPAAGAASASSVSTAGE